MTLRKNLIRLAHENPGMLREALLDVLAAKLTLRQVKALIKKHNLPGEVSGRGTDWEIEVANENQKRKVEKVIKGLGGFKTGYGGWGVAPGLQGQRRVERSRVEVALLGCK